MRNMASFQFFSPQTEMLGAFVGFLIIYFLNYRATRDRIWPKGMPWAGVRNEWFWQIRAHLRDRFDAKKTLEEGYQRVSKSHTCYYSLKIWLMLICSMEKRV